MIKRYLAEKSQGAQFKRKLEIKKMSDFYLICKVLLLSWSPTPNVLVLDPGWCSLDYKTRQCRVSGLDVMEILKLA